MSTNKTPNLNLHSWVGSDPIRRIEWNENFDKLDGEIGNVSNKLTGVLNVMEYGAVGDGVTDDYIAIQNAINAASGDCIVSIPYKETGYLIGETIKIPDNVTIVGNGTKLISKLKFPASGGSHPTCVFENVDSNNGNKNITIKGFVIDGQYSNGTWVGGSSVEQDNLLRFTKVDSLNLSDMQLTNFRNNKNTTSTPNTFYIAFFNDCSNLELNNFKITNIINTEGVRFIYCKNVNLNKFTAYNEQCWTPLHIVYCEGVTVKNLKITEDVGKPWDASTINVFSKNVLFDTCTVVGGKSVDIGDESGSGFVSENVTFVNCYIETTIGIDTTGSPTINNLYFSNNTLHPKQRGFSFSGHSIENLIIKNNTILGLDGNYEGVFFTTTGGASYKNINISDNTIDNVKTGIYFYFRGGQSVEDLFIKYNSITCSPLNGRLSLEGNSVGVHIYMYDIEVMPSSYLRNVFINNNKIDAEGGGITNRYVTPGSTTIDNRNYNINNNVLLSNGLSSERGIQLQGIKDISITNNKIFDLKGNNFITYCNNALLTLNTVKHKDIYAGTATWRIDNSNGFIIAKNNVRVGVIGSNHFYSQSGGNGFTDKIITENIPNSIDTGI